MASRNELNQFGTPGLGQRDSIPGFPSEVTPRNAQLQARSIRGTGTAAGTLKTFDMHVYEFIALEDDSVSFTAVPGTSRDLVLEIWQGERLLVEGDDPSLEPFKTETLLWTAPSGGGRFFLVVRGGYLGAVTSPAEGSYTLTYSVPGTASGDYCQAPGPGPRSTLSGGRSTDQCPSAPTNPTVNRLTHQTARLDWDPGAAGTTYEVRAITGIDCQAGLTDATVLPTTTTTSHWFTMLEPGTDYRFCVRTTRTAGVAPNQFKVHSAWASVDQTTPLELEIASATASSSYCVRSTGVVLVAWTLKGGTLPYTVGGETSRNTFGTATLGCPSNAGQSSVSLFATDGGRPPQNSSVTIPITAVEPLSFQLTTTSFSCETDGSIMVLWELSGGSGSYTVVVEDEGGVAATGDGSAAYDCPDAAGTYTWTLTATDRNVPELNQDASLTLVVTDPEPEPLEITSATTTWQHCVKGVGRVPVDWTAVGGEPPYTTNGVTVDADTVTLLCPGAVGTGAVTLVVTDSGSPARSATADVAITATEALSFELDDSALSCETDETITIDWTLSGGRADYTVTLPSGSTVSASAGTGSTSYECASTAGTRTLTFSVVDASNPMQSDSDSLTITISEAEPDPIMIESAQTTWRHCVAGEDSAPVDWVVSGGVPPYTVNGQAFGASVSSGTVYVDCPATTGSRNLLLLVSDDSDATDDAFELVAITVTSPLSFELDDAALSCETNETITIDWTLSGGEPGYTVTLPGGSTVSASAGDGGASYRCPATAGTRTLTFSVTDSATPAQRDSDSLSLRVDDPPLAFTLADDYQSCTKGETIKVGWSLSGGRAPYQLRITGYSLQRPSAGSGSVDYVCPNVAGERDLTLTVSDSSAPKQRISRTQRVDVELPDYTFTARIRARLTMPDRMEVCLQLSGTNDCILPRLRFFTPSTLRSNTWTNSSMALADYDGDKDRTLGQISVRPNTAGDRLEFQFAACGHADRIVPTTRFFDLSTATVNVWRSTSYFTHTVMEDCASRSLRFPDEDSMTPADGSEPETPGTDGGLMSE